jgi:ethanolamine utilization cobalamin adenosyltransferase
MKFITEDDLRDIYKKQPFTTYELESGTRLTPGARQFLADRGINMFDDEPCVKKFTVTTSSDEIKPKTNHPTVQPEIKVDWRSKKLKCKMKSMEALFLITGEELLSRDVILAQSIISLGKQFASIRNSADNKGLSECISCKECTGIKSGDFCKDIDDCFEITEFHMQLEKGKEILNLHRLRCALREVEPVVLEVYEGSENGNLLCEEIIGKVNMIINNLSYMICLAVGGKECQRKS